MDSRAAIFEIGGCSPRKCRHRALSHLMRRAAGRLSLALFRSGVLRFPVLASPLTYFRFRRTWALQEPDFSLVIVATRVRSVCTEASKKAEKTSCYGVE